MTIQHPLAPHHHGRPIRLRNSVCPYCGCALTKQNSSVEHVVGRRFVPKKSLENQPNLIMNACVECNHKKADLEDDVSAITMQPNSFGMHLSKDPRLAADSTHKGSKSISRYTRKPVADSRPTLRINGSIGANLSMNFSMTGHQQIEDSRVYSLALLHSSSIFYFLTYDLEKARGWWWPGTWLPIGYAFHGDWGNVQLGSFALRTHKWDLRFFIDTADGHFRALVKKAPDLNLWSFSLEWNRNLRVIALAGAECSVKEVASSIEEPKMNFLYGDRVNGLAMRTEVSHDDENDMLFYFEEAPKTQAGQ